MPVFLPYSGFFWAIFGSVIHILAFPKWGLFPLAFLVLPAYLIAIHKGNSWFKMFCFGTVSSLLCCLIGLDWVSFVLQETGGIGKPLSVFLHVLFSFIAFPNLYTFFFLGFLVKAKVAKLPLFLQPLYWACLWVAIEFLWQHYKIFPDVIGATQWPWLSLSQVASLGGVSAISFLVTFFGASLLFCVQYKGKEKTLYPFCLAILFLGAAHIWGEQRIKTIQALPSKDIKIAVIQANISNADKAVERLGNNNAIRSVVERYSELTAQAAVQKPDLVVWPETAYPTFFPLTRTSSVSFFAQLLTAKIMEEAEKGNYSILFGGYEQLGSNSYNSAILIDSKQKFQGSYRKYHLLIFGEYMPFSNIWPSLKKLNPQLGDFARGKGPYPIRWNRQDGSTLNLGVTICYETLIPSFMRGMANNGTDIFFNLTNDSWFGPTNEPHQHLIFSVFRAIENGLPLVRSTNTGISLILDATGASLGETKLFKPEIMVRTVPIPKDRIFTLYKQFGEVFSYFMIFLCFSPWFSLPFRLWKNTNAS